MKTTMIPIIAIMIIITLINTYTDNDLSGWCNGKILTNKL